MDVVRPIIVVGVGEKEATLVRCDTEMAYQCPDGFVEFA